MRGIVAIAAALIAAATAAQAQVIPDPVRYAFLREVPVPGEILRKPTNLIQIPPASAPPSYTGPGDVITGAKFWHGVRAYTAAIAAAGTQPIFDLRRASDNATCTAIIATNGTVDLTVGTPCNGNTQTVTAWIGASSAFVSKWYDQSGNGINVVQATSGAQPQLLLSGCGVNSKPCLQFSSSQFLGVSVGSTTAQPYTFVTEAERVSNFTTQMNYFDFESGTQALYFPTSTNSVRLFVGSDSGDVTASNGVLHEINAVVNGASSTVNVDGTSTGVTVGSDAAGANINVGGVSVHCNVCIIPEDGMWPSNLSSSLAGLHSNMSSYYGSP